jgi:aspartyl-tRNA(Asn)/glutamyl-tRNA(Gln) amidotransferase subunit A
MAVLDRAAAIQPDLNAFTRIDHDGALAAARASELRWRAGQQLSDIDGVPATLKDIVWVAGWPVRYGSRTTHAAPMAEDAPAVARLRAAGAVFIGQTTTPEFGWKAVTDSPAFGISRNPWGPSLTSGGSSGGAAVAAACGAGVLHLGTDGGGSIRIPAAFTGTFGLKPSFGRVPAYPPSAYGTVAHLGPMTRRAADARAMLAVMCGRDVRDWHQPWGAMPPIARRPFSWAGLRIGYWADPPVGQVDPSIRAVVEAVLARLSGLGAQVETIALPGENLLQMFHTHWLTGAANRMAQVPVGLRDQTDPAFADAAAKGAHIAMLDLLAAQTARAQFGAAMDGLLSRFDLILSPSTAVLPFPAGREWPDGADMARWTEWAGFSFPINLSQQPAASVPCGWARGLPVGLQIIGARGADGRVLDAAEAVEALPDGGNDD